MRACDDNDDGCDGVTDRRKRNIWTVYVQMYSHTAVINRYVILVNVLIAFRCFFIYFIVIRLVL